jgi:hypothetical protein
MSYETEIFKTEDFKKAFWEWFDSLTTKERMNFQEYKADMAELYFYNKIYSKRNKADFESDPSWLR